MPLSADKPLPEPENDAPDWTYEELIDTFVLDYSTEWIQGKRKPIERGLISPNVRQLIVELRGATSEPAPINLDFWTLASLHEHRCWFLNMDGLEEIDLAEYQELIADKNFTGKSDYSRWQFCFERGNRTMVSSYSQTRGAGTITRGYIERDDDGKLIIAGGETLGFN